MQLTPVALTLVCFEQTKVEVEVEREKRRRRKRGVYYISLTKYIVAPVYLCCE
jgi:hypothetical protein